MSARILQRWQEWEHARAGTRRRTPKPLPALLCAATLAAFGAAPDHALAQATPCSAAGSWLDSFAGVRNIAATLTGTSKFPYCSATHSMTVTMTGPGSFTTNNRYNGGGDCIGFVESMNFAPSCNQASGGYTNDDGVTGLITWNRTNLLTLTRNTLTTASASATPAGGSFSHVGTIEAGPNPPTVQIASGGTATSNPNPIEFRTTANSGGPKAGGRIKLTSTYTADGAQSVNDRNRVVAFGMSCYMLALESDYGAQPDSCTSTRIGGVTYSGTRTDPNGLSGTYCASFIANVRLQGSGQLNDGRYVNYDVNSNTINVVSEVRGSDNTAVVADRTVARDLAIIPSRGVLVDVDGIGDGLLANDRGGHIVGYRLDLFRGAGKQVCAAYANPIRIGACQTAQGLTCPERRFQ